MKQENIRHLKGIGPRREALFNTLGVKTVKDLLYYFPFRYQDRRDFKKIKDLSADESSVIKARVRAVSLKKFPYYLRSKRIKSIFEAILEDETGSIRCVWFNQAYLSETIKSGVILVIYGKPKLVSGSRQIISPEYAIEEKGDSLGAGKIVGIYRLPSEITQKFMREALSCVLKDYSSNHPDPLPYYIRKKKNVSNIAKSLEGIHFPNSWEEAERIRERFIFEELFFSQILVYLRKAKRSFQQGPEFTIKEEKFSRIRKNLSFDLTFSQEQALAQILNDLGKPHPMRRLLQGDVGCGKTVVAAFAIGASFTSGWQTAFMVPTEVLAYQHKESLEKVFKGLSFSSRKIKKEEIEIITSSLPKRKIEKIYKDLEKGKIKIIVGTHSLIQKGIKFKKLGLVVIDEQHRFGVAQRALLPKKGRIAPHCLVMSATPIPRTLALSLYGDLDISTIKEMPKGRIRPLTFWVKEKKRKWAYDFLGKSLGQGRQIYIVYPVIEESRDQGLKPLKVMYNKIKKKFPDYSVGMFHGRMKPAEKLKAIKDFREKRVDILLATTVVEVGVNIENAATMLVENPERFGLAQLHQLRGRIQRFTYQPNFILISKTKLAKNSLTRLKVISEEFCGFRIAEEDLKLRGPGDFFGNLQHGLPDLKIANPLRDLEILKEARSLAYKVIKDDPYLAKLENRCLRNNLDPGFFLDKKGHIGEEMKK